MKSLSDQPQRAEALDVSRSFIVQAPAGSGKTELLSLRFLHLLAVSDAPEEVLAITFTRKAASEMSDRIVAAIAWAQELRSTGQSQLADPLQQQRYAAAAAVLQQNDRLEWQLLENPGRLRIQTIDSFCLYLSKQLPVLSRIGGNPGIEEDVALSIRDAIHNTLLQLNADSSLGTDIAQLLLHLDNEVGKVEELLAKLLQKRDQWLGYVFDINNASDGARAYLQQSLDELVSESISAVADALLEHEKHLVEMLNFAVENLQRKNPDLPQQNFTALTHLPDADYSSIATWLLIIDLLLTKDSSWRKTVNVANGFPAAHKDHTPEFNALLKSRKQQHMEFLDSLSSNDDLLEALDYLRRLPDPSYSDQQWQFITALTRVLASLSGQLLLSFRKFHQLDYTQLAAAARDALGSAEAPTDLALSLDYRIRHILVDEFQDTSKLQLDILEQLTAGWQPGDGRSLFLVGDPMQSCYGFRNANVGIFLNVQAQGLGSIQPVILQLETNFRSQAQVVDWVNQIFHTAFPQQANYSRGAVRYAKSSAHKSADSRYGVHIELVCYEGAQALQAKQQEAQRIAKLIGSLRTATPQDSIAILVRSRSHLSELLPALRDAGIHWLATDIDTLQSLPVIEDLLSLTRALSNLGDRLAWLAVLRAPWCGLRADDLLAIACCAEKNSIWNAVQQHAEISGLSDDAIARLRDTAKILAAAVVMRGRTSLRNLVEFSWTWLRGSNCIHDVRELDSVAAYLSLLGKHESSGQIADMEEFQQKVFKTFISTSDSSTEENPVHILTMHKAKGLEFDHVILPGLASKPRSEEKSLLQWHERLNSEGDSRLFIAALTATGSDDDPLYKLLRYEQQHKSSLESTRLLYIAVTRAKKSATLFAALALNSKKALNPPPSSLLARIWREIVTLPEPLRTEVHMQAALDDSAAADHQVANTGTATIIRRLRQPISLSPVEHLSLDALSDREKAADDMTGNATAESPLHSCVGVLIHQALQNYVLGGRKLLAAENLPRLRQHWRFKLRQLLSDPAKVEAQCDFIEQSLLTSTSHEQYGWIFDDSLDDSQCELAMDSRLDGGIAHNIIDRTFIASDGRRWIIDYKTAVPDPGLAVEDFVSQQCALHIEQLQSYARLFRAVERQPISTALFFTSLPLLTVLEQIPS